MPAGVTWEYSVNNGYYDEGDDEGEEEERKREEDGGLHLVNIVFQHLSVSLGRTLLLVLSWRIPSLR